MLNHHSAGVYAVLQGSPYDCERGSDPPHADFEGGAEAHPRVLAPAVSTLFLSQKKFSSGLLDTS